MIRTPIRIAAIAILGATLVAGCSRQSVADNTFGATKFVARTAVKGTVGAGKLAYRGAAAGVRMARRDDFPPGTAVCETEDGMFYAAPQAASGAFVCPARIED